jgi:hypothetical protein
MAYRLPSAWSSGYAIPNNVRDEGLQRNAIVTKQMKRGTYDNPTFVNSGDYATPSYVQAEAYGQGARTTDWTAGGTYIGSKIPYWLNQRPQVSYGPNGQLNVTPAAASAAPSALSGTMVRRRRPR